ncbi:hypothetical protein DDI_1973 [Dickeya dianthicola RNS04.9]|uniref:hypothetical protein n=1 Tax=Dickeya dianthicola TaxID=204039 RepID=UPI0003A923E6|nr:hypothetical protein [Dickeya dianthicola]ATO33141.1 hypothetical protein DDI_1973 [Dickeya dianthicola RNS04.9]
MMMLLYFFQSTGAAYLKGIRPEASLVIGGGAEKYQQATRQMAPLRFSGKST